MASVTLGNVHWRRVDAEETLPEVIPVEQIEAEPKTYWLHFTRRSNCGKGKYNRADFHKIIATSDEEAWVQAYEFLQKFGTSKESAAKAELFDGDREVPRPGGTQKLAAEKEGKLV